MPTRIEKTAQTLATWLQAVAAMKEESPLIEPIVGEDVFCQLTQATITDSGTLALQYKAGNSMRTLGCEIECSEDIQSVTTKTITFLADDELGRITRGKKRK